jgi:redox-sensitive bicupin YhaK (pirin superfamily)
VPGFARDGATVTVVVGDVAGVHSPALTCTPLVGAEIVLEPGATLRLPLVRAYEYGAVAMSGAADVAGADLKPGVLLYLDTGRDEVTIGSPGGARLFLLGGEPFDEPLVMWWNFVGRSHEEIAEARADWERDRVAGGGRFGTVTGYAGDPLPAPELPTVRLKARDRAGTVHG